MSRSGDVRPSVSTHVYGIMNSGLANAVLLAKASLCSSGFVLASNIKNVVCRQLRMAASFFLPVSDVFCVRSEPKMRRVATKSVVARMAAVLTDWNRTISHGVGHPMGAPKFLVPPEGAISQPGFRSIPWPAFIWRSDGDLRPKSRFINCAVREIHGLMIAQKWEVCHR